MYKTVRPEHLNSEHMNDPRLRALLDRITLVDSLEPSEVLTAEVELFMRDGTRFHRRVDSPLGDIYANPLSETAILEKYFANVEFGGRVSRANAERAAETIHELEALEDISTLVDLFTAPSN